MTDNESQQQAEKHKIPQKYKVFILGALCLSAVIILIVLAITLFSKNPKVENTPKPDISKTQNTNQPTATNQTTSDLSSSNTTNQAKPSQPDRLATQAKQYFIGKIGEQNINMVLNIEGSAVSGFYSYNHYNTPLKLVGTIEKTQNNDSRFKLDEFITVSGKEQKTGSLELLLKIIDGKPGWKNLTGKWTKDGNNKSVDVALYDSNGENFYLSSGTPNEISISPKINLDKQKKYTISYQYPEISGLKDPQIQQNINQTLKQFTDLNKIKADFENIAQSSSGILEDTPEPLYFDEIEYQVAYNQNQILSIRFIGDYFGGGAHGMHYINTLNFDLKTGKELKLNDLFKIDSKYLELISSRSEDKLREVFSDTDINLYFTEGFEPKIENFQTWSFTPDGGINITFSEYQVVAYAFGTPTIHFTAEELKDILRPEYMFLATPI